MINHARTLLMNVDGSAVPDWSVGEEIVPSAYRARKLSSPLTSARKILFGVKPDRHMLNYRCWQYMNLLHATELRDYVTWFDSRITYDFAHNELLTDPRFGINIEEQIDNGSVLSLAGGGSPISDVSGQVLRQWSISAVRDTPQWASVDIGDLTDARSYSDTVSMAAGDMSQPFKLPGSNIYMRVEVPSVGQWLVTSLSRPQASLGSLVASLEGLGEPVLRTFGVGSPIAAWEPFRTFYGLWKGHKELPYKLGGLLLALIYMTNWTQP